MNDRPVQSTDATDLRESLLYVLADAETFDDAVERTLEAICRAGGWEYGESWLPGAGEGDAASDAASDPASGADGVSGDGERADEESAHDVEEADAADRLVVGHTWAAPGFEAFAAATEATTFGPGEGLIGRVWAGDEPEWIPDLTAPEAEFTRARAAADSGLVSGVAIRLPERASGDPDIEPIAVLAFFTATPREADLGFARAAADIVAETGRLFARRRRHDAVAEDRRLLHAVLDVTPHPLVVLDADGEVERLNAAAEAAIGVDAAALRERGRLDERWAVTTADGDPLPVEDRPISVALATARPAADRLRITLPNGTRRTVDLRASPVVGADGDIERVVASFTDVTDQVAYERDLEDRNAELDRFTAVVSHDLRNPLAVIEGYVDLATQTDDVGHLERASAALDRVNGLVDSLLLLARHGRIVGDFEGVSLDDAVGDAWHSVDGEAATLVVESGLPTVAADPVRLGQLLENLFANAVTHAGEDVTVVVEPLAEGAGFTVTDDGPGIPAEDRDRVFDPGTGSDDGGLGLGLALVRSIAEAHGWRVHVEDGPAGGARFVVAFGDGADSE